MPRCPSCKQALTEATEEDCTLYCDGGCAKKFKPGVARWCCSTCDFDVCENCTVEVVTEQADLAAAEAQEALRRLFEAEAEEEADGEAGDADGSSVQEEAEVAEAASQRAAAEAGTPGLRGRRRTPTPAPPSNKRQKLASSSSEPSEQGAAATAMVTGRTRPRAAE